MEDARALASLQETVKLIGDERLLEGWAAYGAQSGPSVLGPILVTDGRVVFVDTAGGMMAFPILKISTAEVTAPCHLHGLVRADVVRFRQPGCPELNAQSGAARSSLVCG